MQVFNSPAILGQETVDPNTVVVVKVISPSMPLVKIVPMPGTKGDKGDTGNTGPQGPPGSGTDLAEVTFGSGLNYNSVTKTITITSIDGGVI